MDKWTNRWEIQQSVRSGALLRDKKLVLLVFSKKEAMEKLRWEHDGEFEYQGWMYDVVETENQGDTIRYRCFLDHRETNLNHQIRAIVAKVVGNQPQNKENQKRLSHFFQMFFLPAHAGWNNLDYNRDFEYCPHVPFSDLSLFFKPPVPPPRIS